MTADADERLFAVGELVGEVLGVVFVNPDNGFGVVELERAGDKRGFRVAGPLADVVAGQIVRVAGRLTQHPRYGETFEATYYEQLAPTTVPGLRSFLSSERFEAVPDAAVTSVLATFGADAGRVIEHEPDRLVVEAGLAADVAAELVARWQEGRALAALVREAEPAGLPLDVVRAVHARFGGDAMDTLRDNPFVLVEVDGARFAHAEALARHLGLPPDDPRRLVAGARAAVGVARRQDGHQLLVDEQVVAASAALLRVEHDQARDGLEIAVETDVLVDGTVRLAGAADDVRAVYTPAAHAVERDLAAHLRRLLAASPTRLAPFARNVSPSSELTSGQAEAVRAAFDAPVTVLTGGPGTGKTRTIEEVVRAAEDCQLNVVLCAPTGRAAKRLEELVGRPAATVHRVLEAHPVSGGGFAFRRGPDEPLPHDLVVVDEVSMCDTALACRLVGAVEDGAHLLLVGDPDQLPSVGSGDVLRDLLRSGALRATRLTEIHRQAAGSRIVALAREIDAGAVGPLQGRDGDVYMAEEPRRDAVVPRVVEAVAERAPAFFDVTTDDIQVIAPIYRGPAGVDALNVALKAACNPAAGRSSVAGFHVGDRVMQTRNDPDRDVSNGDIGTVVDLDLGQGALRVAFPRGEVECDRRQVHELTAAWAITVHKSQGGEWPVVVLACDRSHRSMLWRNLAYTAVTRAQRALIVVGQSDALRDAARQDRPRNRQTALAWRLRELGAAEDDARALPAV